MHDGGLETFDYVLVGGGLSSALIALALFEHQPRARVALVEQCARLGGNHLWCFHAGDIGEACDFVAPLVVRQWSRYEVRFPALTRVVEEPYAAVSSERLDAVVRRAFESRRKTGSLLLLSEQAAEIGQREVRLASGRALRGQVVIESRGPEALRYSGAGYQKFVGLELDLRAPALLSHPLLMDALVPQEDGFRFMYVLPLASQRVLIEDTYFSDDCTLDVPLIEARIFEYARRHGFRIAQVARRERGVLPLPTSVPELTKGRLCDGPLVAGYQGGWFHPVTGYSFPLAARLAVGIASASPQELREKVWPALARRQRAQLRFGILLNRLMFGAFAPRERYGAIERFYRLPTASVRRFYALNLTSADRLRILCGKPPHGFSIPRALGYARSTEAP